MILFNCMLLGADIVGDMEYHGLGNRVCSSTGKSVEQLWEARHHHNEVLVSKLREDVDSTWLKEHTEEEARLGRTTWPVCEEDVGHVLLHPRFAISQLRLDGSVKLRAIDHGSWAPDDEGREGSLNGFTSVADSLSHHTLDHLGVALKTFYDYMGEVPHLFKADIDSAFRRIPIARNQRKFCGIAFKHGGKVSACSVGHSS